MIGVLNGDCVAALGGLEAESFSACVTDPPYHLTSIVKRFGSENAAPAKSNGATGVYARSSKGFMGKAWDGGDVAFRPETWAAVLRVLKPGAYLVAFASTRGYHRMVCAIEDAGFVIHPMLGWIFGSGFPKAHDLSKAIDRAAGSEREVVGFDESKYRPNRINHGLVHSAAPGHFQADNGATITAPATALAAYWRGWAYGLQSLKPALEPICLAQKPFAEVTSADTHAATGWDHWCSQTSDGDDRIVTARALHVGVRSHRLRLSKDGRELAREDLGEYRPFVIDNGTANVLRHGTGALNIDAGRVATGEDLNGGAYSGSLRRRDEYASADSAPGAVPLSRLNRGAGEFKQPLGRWPANLAHDGSPEVMEAFARFGERSGQAADVNGSEPSSKTDNVYGQFDGRSPAARRGDTGTAARFFKACQYSQDELLFSRAKSIIEAWNSDIANTADSSSSLSSERAASVLSDAVLLASSAGSALSNCQGLGTSVTPTELNDLATMLIVEILSIGSGCLRGRRPDALTRNESPVSYAEAIEPTGTIRITISHWKSDGSADAAIFEVILLNGQACGEARSGGANRFHFGAKAASWEREGDHPTVKPVALMEWLVKLVTPPGGAVLDPFCGTGSTLVACDWLGIDAVGIEQDAKTCADAERKIKRLRARRLLGSDPPQSSPLPGQMSLDI